MPQTDSDAIRETFLRFFERHAHTRINGASIVPVNDPTLLFINAGMAPLKKFFTGEDRPPATDLCNVQGCIRTKDIDDVGDRHHITFFEMLGSWSIGGYFKERAVELAWELLTADLALDPNRLYVTVFGGDKSLGLPADEESAAAWESVGVPRDRIVALPAADNFWGPAGASGPCGPCTEVFLDTGDQFGPAYVPGGEFDSTSRYIEIWNAGVFMQFDKGLDGVLRPLPFTSVDTGSGLERLQLALNGLDSLYDTDLFVPIVRTIQDALGETGEVERHHRVIADHMRAAVAIMSEGVMPGNEGRGYIPRRLIRRCMTQVMSRQHEEFPFAPIAHAVLDRMERYYPVWGARRAETVAAIGRECEEFGRTVRRGLEQLDRLVTQRGEVTGADAFNLFATYGLPIEITADLASGRGVRIDRREFDTAFTRHKELSRGGDDGGARRRLKTTDVLPAILSPAPRTEFVGYDSLTAEARILAVFSGGALVDTAAAGAEIDVVVDRSPFYGEGGGQVGDRGVLETAGGRGEVTDTQVHDSGRYVHRVTVTSGELREGDEVTLTVDAEARRMTAANHTATHLLNAALREVLGDHVRQAGSLVEPQRLRFDFTHPKPMTKDEIAAVERQVNAWVLADAARHVEVMTPSAAKSAGALSLDGEDYGAEVRVLSFGGFSKELCGGTHLDRTSTIGSFRILTEQSVAAGVRRIVAVTRERAIEHTMTQASSLLDVAAALRTSQHDVVAAVERLSKSAKQARPVDSASVTRHWEINVGDIPVTLAEATGAVGGLRKEAQRVIGDQRRVAVLWDASGDKTTLVIGVPNGHTDRLKADALLKEAARRFGGAGGGNARMAQGGLDKTPPADGLVEIVTELLGRPVDG